jgi:Domain of unknown function (DUF4166)
VTSPFASELGPHVQALPTGFRDQYLFEPNERVVLDGIMQRVWRRGRWLWPLFWLASWFDALFPETGSDVPVILKIQPNKSGKRHLWRREFHFSRRRRRFTSRMEYDERLGCVVELIGLGGALALAWHIHFESPNRLLLKGSGWFLRIGPWRLRLPEWMLGTGQATETADQAKPGAIRIDFVVSHPFLGDVFGYAGTFQVRREAPTPQRSPSDG